MVEIIQGGQSSGPERGEILRNRSNFLQQKRFFKLGLKLNLIVAPAAEQIL